MRFCNFSYPSRGLIFGTSATSVASGTSVTCFVFSASAISTFCFFEVGVAEAVFGFLTVVFMNTRTVLKILKLLNEHAREFDATFVINDKVNVRKIARFCGSEMLEFSLLEDKTGHTSLTLIRVRK